MNIMNPKMILTIAAIVIVGWIAVSAIDAGSEWDSPFGTVQEVGKRFTCPAPEHAKFTFDVVLPKDWAEASSITFDTTDWVAEGTTGGFFPAWWIFASDFRAELQISYEANHKTYNEEIKGVGTTLLDEQWTGTVVFVTDINKWTGECADDWSYVSGYPIDYTIILYQDNTQIDSQTGTITSV